MDVTVRSFSAVYNPVGGKRGMAPLRLVKADIDAVDWVPLGALLLFYGACVLALLTFGGNTSRNPVVAFFERISDTLRRITGLPGWSMAGALSGLLFLLIAVI